MKESILLVLLVVLSTPAMASNMYKRCSIKTDLENYSVKFWQLDNGKMYIIFNKSPWFSKKKPVTEYKIENDGLDETHASGNYLHFGKVEKKGVIKINYLSDVPPQGFDEILSFQIGDGAINDGIAEFGKYWTVKGICRNK